jgi:hypothetical protein
VSAKPRPASIAESSGKRFAKAGTHAEASARRSLLEQHKVCRLALRAGRLSDDDLPAYPLEEVARQVPITHPANLLGKIVASFCLLPGSFGF